MSKDRSRRYSSMPSLRKIHEYWSFKNKRLYEKEDFWWVSDCFDDGEPRCYACGSQGIERCHILAYVIGGTNSVENIHLLCKSCHSYSEILDGERYWAWIINKPIMRDIERLCWQFGIKLDPNKDGMWDEVISLVSKVIPDLMQNIQNGESRT